MKTALLLALAAIPTITAKAQQPDWLVSWPVGYSLNPGMPAHVLASSPNGHLMSARLQTGALSYGQDIFGGYIIERLDPGTGQALWSCFLGDSMTVESGAVDPEGNVYAAGRFMGDLAMCDGSVLGVSSSGFLDNDIFLMKFAPDGQVLWARNISAVAPMASSIPVMAIDPVGNAWYGTTDFILSRFARVDEDGNDTETRFIDGGKTLGGLAFDPSGGMYVSGSCDQNAFAFGGLNPTLPTNDFYLMFLARFRPEGSGHWARFAHDITFQRPDIAVDHLGNVAITGGLLDSTNWGGFHLNGPDWGIATFVAKADSTGEFLWALETDTAGGPIEGDLAQAARRSIGTDADGRIYMTGTLRGEINWGGGVVSDGLTIGQRTQTVVAFSPDGNALWAGSTVPISGFTNAMGLTCLDDGTVYFSAHVIGTYEFLPHTLNEGGQQAYLIGRISDPASGFGTAETGQNGRAWPVPADGRVSLFNPRPWILQARIVSADGRQVSTLTLNPGTNTMDIRDMAAGLYHVIGTNGERWRLVKE
jgi:outer membrane protein assembly factor BamB